MSAEIIVLDNGSSDGSLEYLKPKFPKVVFIENYNNIGFAQACNKGFAMASGDYILFLNPDTLLAEDTLEVSLSFFKTHSDCGAIGVKMIDGGGVFLKESKRSFPSPLISLYKLSGLARIFPGSKAFGGYHLGHYDPDQNHEVSVLSGAFMMVPKEVLAMTGCFDERFFMYGEDVDLSYRILQGGYKNYYVAQTTIVHFKGESTRKGSLNYVRMFYQAMSLFVQKHYGGTKAWSYNAMIQLAIAIRASLAAMSKLLRWVGLPIIDGVVILFSFWVIKEIWVSFIRPDIIYTPSLLNYSFPAFTAIYLLIAYFAGLYDRYYLLRAIIRSTLVATILLIAFYSLLPEHLRFSRGIILFGALLSIILIVGLRIVLVRVNFLATPQKKTEKPSLLIAGSKDEFDKVFSFLEKSKLASRIIGRIAIGKNDLQAITDVEHVSEIALPLEATEIILCAGSLSYQTMIQYLPIMGKKLKIRFYAPTTGSIISSDVHSSRGEILSDETGYNLSYLINRRQKRLLDLLTAFIGILGFPFHLFFIKKPTHFFINCIRILQGKLTWIGYFVPNNELPMLAQSVLGPNGNPQFAKGDLSESSLKMIDYYYARNYEWIKDCKILLLSYKLLGS
ncbi:MAG: glycosyltransferase [Flavisolibacter sp.]